MTTYEKWSNYVYAAIAGIASVVNLALGEFLVGVLYATIALGFVIESRQQRKIADLQYDLDAALKRERDHIKRYAKAEAQVAYHEYLRKQRRDALVNEFKRETRAALIETFAKLDAKRGDAE